MFAKISDIIVYGKISLPMQNAFGFGSLVAFLYMIGVGVFAQNVKIIDRTKYIAHYNYEYFEDSLSASSIKNGQMNLYVGEKVSCFTSPDQYCLDSLFFANTGTNEDELFKVLEAHFRKNNSSPGSFCDYAIYKNFPATSKLTFVGTVSPESVMSYEEAVKMTWRFCSDPETKILGYRCLKATTVYAGRVYEAWYSPDIPLNDGPYKFQGLPGLIVKINDVKKQHAFTLVRLAKCKGEKPIFYMEREYVKGSPSSYVHAKKSRDAVLLQKMIKGEMEGLSETSIAKAIDRFKRRNNYIEKY